MADSMITQPAQAVNPGPADFVAALYGDKPQGWLVVWTRQDRLSRWFRAADHDEIEQQAAALAAHYDVYYGVGLQAARDTSSQRGKADTVTVIPGLWLDLDCRGGSHKATNLPTLDEARSFLGLFGLAPSIIVHTGGGLHVYWLFRRPWVFRDHTERKQAAEQVSRFQAALIALAAARGWKMDNTSDLARVLRLPGTLNHKTAPPAPVRVVDWHPERRYSYGEITAAIERMEAQAKTTRPPGGQRSKGQAQANDDGPLLGRT